MKKAYSYIRYSSPQQAKGDSFRRQFAATQAYCEKNGYELDTELAIYQELGTSASEIGSQEILNNFIDDCVTGKVQKGSLLIVENLDRLSRLKVNQAMLQFLTILNYVDIYTTQDEKHYSNDDNLDGNAQLIAIVSSVLIMSRAYEESETKKKRLKESWDSKRKNIDNKKLTSLIPHWLELSEDRTEFHLKKDRVEIIKYIYQKSIDGMGVSQLIRHLNENLIQFPTPTHKSKLWARTSLSRILTDRSVLGEYQPHIGKHNGIGEKKRKPLGDPIPDYYPQIIDEETFLKAQIARKSRIVGRGKVNRNKFSNLFRNILRCSYCDGKVEYVDKGDGSRGGKYLTCSNSKRGGECSHNKHYKYLPLELMLLHLTTENGFMPKPEAPTQLNLRLSKLQDLNEKAESKLRFLLDGDFTIPSIKQKIEILSKEIERYSSEIEHIENKILTFKPDYTYSDLYQNVIAEDDPVLLSSNRMTYNSYLSKKIESAYLFNDYSNFILFKMKDQHVHTVMIDQEYNFGGCSLPNHNMTYKRLNGDRTPIDEMIWNIQQDFLKLIESCKNIHDKKLENYLNRINKLISKIILEQEIELFNQVLFQIDKAHKVLAKIEMKQ